MYALNKDAMIINDRIIVKNYKCFDSSGGGFDKFLPINVIIGKNNSGKSSLINLVQFLIQSHKEFIDIGRDNSQTEVLITHILTKEEVSSSFSPGTSGGGIPKDHFEFGKSFIGKSYTYTLGAEDLKSFIKVEVPNLVDAAIDKVSAIVNGIKRPFINKIFCNITAERDIIPEKASRNLSLKPNGVYATNLIQEIINLTKLERNLIENEFLSEMNKIINPDIYFERILVQLNDNEHWEIFFEDKNNKIVALSKMGSGIKTVLLVLLNLIVKPVIDKNSKDMYVFAFEELENNLHPALQRRLYNYIKQYSEKNKSYFFLTTHSNIVIDSFGTCENAQLIHVINDGEKSKSSTILSQSEQKKVLRDLDVKASDILQSNGIVWVEGPSDRNYLNKWISILAPSFQEGLHYSIMYYAGRLLSNLTFDFEWFKKEIIPLLRINTNAFVLIDKDGKTINSKLNETKERISAEIGNDNCWITKGREIENYLKDDSVIKWLKNKHNCTSNFKNDINTKLEDNILKSNKTIKLKYNLSKTAYSSEITEFIDKDSFNVLDLKEKLEQLILKIKEWNDLE